MEIKFYSLKDKLPDIGETVLVRYSYNNKGYEYILGKWEYDKHKTIFAVGDYAATRNNVLNEH